MDATATATEADALIGFLRNRLAEQDDVVARQTIALYEQTREHIDAMAGHGIDAQGSRIAAESYVSVLRLYAAQWADHEDYEGRFRCGWMDELPE